MALSTQNLSQDDVNRIIAAGENGITNIGGMDYTTLGVQTNQQDGGYTPQMIAEYQPGTDNAALAQRAEFGMNGDYMGLGKNLDGGALDTAGMIALALISGGTLWELGMFGDLGIAGAPTSADAATTAGTVGGTTEGVGVGSSTGINGMDAMSDLASTSGTVPAGAVNAGIDTTAWAPAEAAQATQAVQEAVQQGAAPQSAIQSVAKTLGVSPSTITQMLGAAGNAIGNNLLKAAGVAANVAGGAISADAAKSAGNQIAAGAQKAADILTPAYGQASNILAGGYQEKAALEASGLNSAQGYADATLNEQRSIQQPYMDAGKAALNTLSAGLAPGGQFNRAFSMADMENVMPAFTFARDEGLQAMNNQMAMGGQQLSSNAVHGAGTLAEGIASQFEGQAFNQWLAQNNLTLGALQNMVHTGQISTDQLQAALAQHGLNSEQIQKAIGQAYGEGTLGAAQTYAAGTMGSAGAQANAAQQAANANAAGTVGSANAITAAIGNTANGLIGNAALDAATRASTPAPAATPTNPATYVPPTNTLSYGVNDNSYTYTNPYDGSYGFGSGTNFGQEDLGQYL
jgi:hypothetical protein